MDNLKAQGTKAFIWDFSGKLAMHGTGFIVTIFLARLLEPAEFGLVAMVMVIIGIAQIFTDVGLGSALIQRRRVLPVHYSSVFYFNIVIGSILTLITFLSAPLIAGFYNNEQLIPLAQVMSIAFLINAFSSVQATKLRKELNYQALTVANFTSSLLSGIVGVFMAFNGGGVWSLVALTLSRGVIFNIYVWIVAGWVPSLLFSFKALMQLWGFGFRMFLSGALDAVFTRLDVIIIGKLFTPAVLGFFDRAKSLDQMIVYYSSGSLMSVLFPVLSKVQNDLSRFQSIIIKALGVISFVVFLLLGVMYLISEELVVILFSEKWLPSAEYFKLLILSGFAYPVSALLVNVLSSRGNSKAFLRLEIYKKIVFGSNLAIAFMWGIEGYLYGLVLASILAVYLNIIFASVEIRLPKFSFVQPIIVQMTLALITVIGVKELCLGLEYSNIIMLLLKASVFTILYILASRIFGTSSYKNFVEQILPVIQQIRRKLA
ncbi:lipopolysaccharide biosynthesis protein [Sulfurovum sp.]|uniref:lipopolysaccharide biosynthesis protein n=1 Tax=Sulfurovum sp. TaxID=1969726 RepID=UPI00356632D8